MGSSDTIDNSSTRMQQQQQEQASGSSSTVTSMMQRFSSRFSSGGSSSNNDSSPSQHSGRRSLSTSWHPKNNHQSNTSNSKFNDYYNSNNGNNQYTTNNSSHGFKSKGSPSRLNIKSPFANNNTETSGSPVHVGKKSAPQDLPELLQSSSGESATQQRDDKDSHFKDRRNSSYNSATSNNKHELLNGFAPTSNNNNTLMNKSNSLNNSTNRTSIILGNWHEKLRLFEASRRRNYSDKLERLPLYCQSYQTILEKSLWETQQARRFVTGVAKAHERLYKRLEQVKKVNNKSHNHQQQQQQSLVNESSNNQVYNPRKGLDDDGGVYTGFDNNKEDDGTLLHSLQHSHDLTLERFQESSQLLERQIVLPLIKLEKTAKNSLQDLRKAQAVLQFLQKIEQQVCEAWDVYTEAVTAAQSFSESNVNDSTTDNKSPRDVRNFGSSFSDKNAFDSSVSQHSSDLSSSDLWLLEWNYRTNVQQHAKGWEFGLFEFSEIFGQVKAAECQRRINLREYLILFVHIQQKVFIQVEASVSMALTDWTTQEIDSNSVERDLQKAMQQKMSHNNNQEQNNNNNNTFSNDFSLVDRDSNERQMLGRFYEEFFSSIPPLESEYIRYAVVVDTWWENKNSNTGSSPLKDNSQLQQQHQQNTKKSLLIFTKQKQLYFYELPVDRVDSNIALGTSNVVQAIEGISLMRKPTASAILSEVQVSMGKQNLVVDLDWPGRQECLKVLVDDERTQINIISVVYGGEPRDVS